MRPALSEVAGAAGRRPEELTRRDVARALLAVPAAEARPALAGLREELAGHGKALSAAFWDSAEQTLATIERGEATFGDVRRWLESTGTEPTQLIGTHVWEDEGWRTELGDELHAALVAHLEERVAAGDVDPDRLVAGDEDAWEASRSLQRQWLWSPLPDGRVPAEALQDEEDEALFAAWDAADEAAREHLDRILAEVGERPCPREALRAACDRLRSALGEGDPWHDLLAAAGGVDRAHLTADDAELWLTLAAGTVTPRDEPPEDQPSELMSAWIALQHADWVGAVAALARSGPGTAADERSLAGYVVSSVEIEWGDAEQDESEWDDEADWGAVELEEADWDVMFDEAAWGDVGDVESSIAFGFLPVVGLWRQLGAVDADDRLTPLGWWGLPEALRRAWTPREA